MVKYFVLFICLDFAVSLAYAQQLDWSKPMKVRDKAIYPEILGKSDDDYFVARTNKDNKQTLILSRYNSSLIPVANLPVKFDRDEDIEALFFVHNYIYVFFSSFDKSESAYIIKCKIFNADFKIVKDVSDILKIPKGTKVYYFNIDLSPDKENFHIVSLGEDGELSKLSILVLNKEVIPETNTSYEIDKINSPTVLDYLINEQKAYFLFGEKLTKKELKEENPKHYLTEVNLSNNDVHSFPLFTDSVLIKNGKIGYDALNDKIVVTGFFSVLDSALSKGIYYFNKPSGNDSFDIKYIHFSQDFLVELQGRNRKDYGLGGYIIKKQILRSDGGALLIAEKYAEKKETYSDMVMYGIAQTYVRDYFYYQDIVIFSITPQGELEWDKFLRKDQVSVNDNGYYSSFITTTQKNKIVFIFNDLNRKVWHLLKYELTPNGELSGDVMVNGNNFEGYFIPRQGAQVSHNEVLIPGIQGNDQFVLLKVTF